MKRKGLIILVFLLTMAISLPAFAHIASTYKWGSSYVYYYPNFTFSEAVSRTKEAANDWNSNVPDFQFRVTSSGGHSLYMGTTDPLHSGETTVDYSLELGHIDDADTCFNKNMVWNWSTSSPTSSQMDFLTICKHELGHWYLLYDCATSSHSNTMMYKSTPFGVRKTIQSHDSQPARDMY